jgi:hypothetical protein
MIEIKESVKRSTVISLADVVAAEQLADQADQAAADAWQAVECATRRALQLEATADRLRAIAQRTALQVGWRKTW